MTATRLLLVVALALACATGCHTHASMSSPAGFGRLDGGYDVRAVNPNGVVVAARVKPNRPRADLGFWAAAVDLSLARKGYSRTELTDVTSRAGVRGKLMKYDTHAGTAYWIAVFARTDTLLLAEATGAHGDVDASSDQLLAALLSARID
ncbi:MAG: hypothetical protein KIT31_29180 [Deltaproteobacteria bacterium]|nr:hypothetical protein [Deltaproteobacteria bacterium]